MSKNVANLQITLRKMYNIMDPTVVNSDAKYDVVQDCNFAD